MAIAMRAKDERIVENVWVECLWIYCEAIIVMKAME
jgi:hypothetical protein